MKSELKPSTIALVIGVAAVILVVIGIAVFKPSFGPGPVVQPKPFTPPAGYKAPVPGAPMGAAGAPGSKAPEGN